MGYFAQFNAGKGIPFMEGREKANLKDVLDRKLHIDDFGFIKGEEGEYAVISFAEDKDYFYFANAIVTDALKKIKEDGKSEELKDVAVVFTLRMSNKNREYVAIEFIED